jgi:chemotaxis protein methyltransferase CheR
MASNNTPEEIPVSRLLLEEIELDLLIEGLYRTYDYDFRHYSRASLMRRILAMLQQENLDSISQLQALALHDVRWAKKLIRQITVTYTEMFRDPEVFLLLRNKVSPILASYPFLRIWHVGVATGEEVYTMAIMLSEIQQYRHAIIYATDINSESLQQAQEGIYPLGKIQQYTKNYLAAGGTEDFSKYYVARFGAAAFDASLKENITFALHNLITDSSFNVFNLILCRNVTIYFDEVLTKRVHEILYDSLELQGILVLGDKENLLGSPYADRYKSIDRNLSVYQKIA